MEPCILQPSDIRLELIFHSFPDAYKAFIVDYRAKAKFTAFRCWKLGIQNNVMENEDRENVFFVELWRNFTETLITE